MQISITDDVQVMQVQVPGQQGPKGAKGDPGQSNVLTIGSVTTLAAGSNAVATISGVSPSQTLNLSIPQGAKGDKGDTGATPTITSGTINAVQWDQPIGTTLTGTAPNYILNLSIPKGRGFNPTGAFQAFGVYHRDDTFTVNGSVYLVTSDYTSGAAFGGTDSLHTVQWVQKGDTGDIGPANTLTIGTVATGAPGSAATATITGTAPNQTLSLSVPRGADGAAGAAANMSIGTVTTLAAGASATATISGTGPNYVLNLGIPQGAAGSSGTSTDATASAKGIVQLAGDLGGTAAAPTVTGGTHHTHTSSQISDAASAATVSKVIVRDAAGRAQVVDPSVAADIATKNYVDTKAVKNTGAQTIDDSAGAVTDNVLVLKSPASYTGAFLKLNSGGTDYLNVVLSTTGSEPTLYNPRTGTTNQAIQLANANGAMRILPYTDGNVYVQSSNNGLSFTGLNGADGTGAVTFGYASAVFHGPIQSGGKVTNVTDPTVAQDAATKNYVDTKIAGTVLVLATGAAIPAGTPANTLIVRY